MDGACVARGSSVIGIQCGERDVESVPRNNGAWSAHSEPRYLNDFSERRVVVIAAKEIGFAAVTRRHGMTAKWQIPVRDRGYAGGQGNRTTVVGTIHRELNCAALIVEEHTGWNKDAAVARVR